MKGQVESMPFVVRRLTDVLTKTNGLYSSAESLSIGVSCHVDVQVEIPNYHERR